MKLNILNVAYLGHCHMSSISYSQDKISNDTSTVLEICKILWTQSQSSWYNNLTVTPLSLPIFSLPTPPLLPLQLALTAATPIFRGYLSDVDCRWDVVAASVDCRTREERGLEPLRNDKFVIPKSRYGSVDCYLSECGSRWVVRVLICVSSYQYCTIHIVWCKFKYVI